MIDLEGLEKLRAEGTVDRWEAREKEPRSYCWSIGTAGEHIADLFYCREEDHAYVPYDDTRARANAALIVAAVNALPELIAMARRVEELEAALKEIALCNQYMSDADTSYEYEMRQIELFRLIKTRTALKEKPQ